MRVDLAPGREPGLRLRHPVLVAAGGAGYGNELLEAVGDRVPGAITTRSVSRQARRGEPPPRMVDTAGGLLSSVGLDNPGLEEVLRRQATRWAASEVPIIVSICADSAEDIAWLVRQLDLRPEVAAIELNLACPDRGRDQRPIGLDTEASEIATVAARAATELPLIVKLSPLVPEPRDIARAVAAAGADAISATGAWPGLSLAASRDGASLGSTYGWLSGPAVKPLSLRVVFEIAQVVRIPVIGIGGVSELGDVLDYLAAGASAVGIATAALGDPALPGRLGEELAAWCRQQGIGDLRELVGTALPRRHDRGSLRSGPFRR